MGWWRRVIEFFEPDNTWERPLPASYQRSDLRLCVISIVLASFSLELARSVAPIHAGNMPIWQQHVLAWIGVAPMAIRRRFPISTMALSQLVLILLSMRIPTLAGLWSTQVASVAATYAGAAWARDRRSMLLGLGATLLMNLTYGAFTFAVGSGVQQFNEARHATGRSGVLPPVMAYVLYWVLLNQIYILASAVGGQSSWRRARQQTVLERQNTQLMEQAATLKDQAQVEERLRIARELHDVVAHHVSVIGIQAAGARKVLHRDPVQAGQALTVVEASSRQAVAEMRSLLGTLRAQGTPGPDDGPPDNSPDRAPDPSAADIERLVLDSEGLKTSFALVEDRPGALGRIPRGVGLALYRTVQESLANVRRHSTATCAEVILRIGVDQTGQDYAEVEVLDEGRPRRNTSGSGLGLLGVRERIASLGGSSEIGPRVTGGYRVRIRFPIPAEHPSLQVVS